MLFIKECKALSKSIVYLIFVIIMILFYSTQFEPEVTGDIRAATGNMTAQEEERAKQVGFGPLVKPSNLEGKDLGYRSAMIPEMIMPNATASLVREWSLNEYSAYPAGFAKISRFSDSEQDKVAGIVQEITGIHIDEVREIINDAVADGKIEPIPNIDWAQLGEQIDYSKLIPIVVDFDSFKEKMTTVDKMTGGGSSYAEYNLEKFAFKAVTPEDLIADYESLTIDDKITRAYARLFCDYMGIVICLLGVFVPVAFMLRERRSRMEELIYPRTISSLKLIGTKFLAIVTMMFVPVLLLSCVPLVHIASFASDYGYSIDYFAFITYSFAWILPSLLVVVGVGFALTILTDTPIGILVQSIWSFSLLFMSTGANLASLAGKSGFSLLIRFNTAGDRELFIEQFTAMIINRVSFAILGLVLIAISIALFEMKRKGRLDVRRKLRKKRTSNTKAA